MKSIPGFQPDHELEKLLDKNPGELDDETLFDVQLYKAKKLKAKQKAGLSTDKPEWWHGGPAPVRVNHRFSPSDNGSQVPPAEGSSTDEEATEARPEEPPQQPSETREQAPAQADEADAPSVRPAQTTGSSRPPVARAPRRDGLPAVGWSSAGVTGESHQELLGDPSGAGSEPPSRVEQPEPMEEPEPTGDPILDYYRSVKHSIASRGTSARDRVPEDETPGSEPSPRPAETEGEDPVTADSVEPTERDSAEAKEAPSGSQHGTSPHHQLTVLLQQAHRTNLQLKDEIAALREDRARLEERLNHLQNS